MRHLILFGIVAIGLSISSCSKCYECKAPVEVKTPDTTYVTYQNQELCTANADEVKEKEAEGYDCN